MIPYEELSQPAAAQLMEYLRQEITRALSERRPLEERWLRWQRLYKAIPEREVKEFPFYGAANLVLPVIATDVDTIYSRIMGILFEPENLWACAPLRSDAVLYAPRLQEFLAWAQTHELKAYEAVADFILELTKLGTGVLKERYRRSVEEVYEFRETPMGTTEKFSNVMVKDNPELSHVSLYDFLVPSSATADQETWPWCAERILLNWNQLQERVRAGIYQATDRLAAWNAKDKGSWITQELQRMDSFSPGLATQFELWEVWTKFAIRPNDPRPVPVVCTIHLPTMTYLRIDYNPFFHQEYPYSVARYLRQEKRFYGIGLAEMDESFQDEVTTMHNQRLDNHTIANSVMMKARKGIGIRDDEPVMPGRWFLLDNMEDVETMQMGRNFDSSIQDEQMTMSYSTKRTGVNDYVMGNPDNASIGYSTASTNIIQHQEAAKRFDQTLREIRKALSSSGRRIVELYQQFNQGGKTYQVLGQEDGHYVDAVFQFPLELIRRSISIDVTASSASLNKDTQVRTNTIVMQMVSQQFYPQLFQALQIVLNPQVPPVLRQVALQMVIGGSTLMRRILDAQGVQDIDTIVPNMEEILGQQQPGGLAGPSAYPGGVGGPPAALPFGGMASLPPGAPM